MAITNIQVNFTPCPDPPVGGYNIEYRVVGDVSYIDAGSFVSSPANIPVSYPDGTEFEGIVHSDCGDVVWSTATVPPDDGCGCRFGYPLEDVASAGEDRNFDLGLHQFIIHGGVFDASLLQLRTDLFDATFQISDGTAASNLTFNASIAGSAVNFYLGSNNITNNINIQGNAVANTLKLNASTGAIFLNSTLAGTAPGYVWTLVDSATGEGEWAESTGGGSGSGSSLFRFGYITEDDTAGEDRVFQLGTDYQVRFNGSVPGGTKDSMFKVTNAADEGTSIYGVSTGADGVAVRGDSDGVAGLFISVNDAGVVAQSTNGPGALIHSTNDIGAQISTDSGSYATESRTTTTTDNNQVHPNLLLNAISTIVPVADGFGQSIDFQTNTTDLPTTRLSNQIISLWVTADDATAHSVMIVTGVTAGSLQNLLFIEGNGIFTLPLGLTEYADDTAAAAGTPPIPIGGLYRIGNTPQIRLT